MGFSRGGFGLCNLALSKALSKVGFLDIPLHLPLEGDGLVVWLFVEGLNSLRFLVRSIRVRFLLSFII
jgi:hypothetical protein